MPNGGSSSESQLAIQNTYFRVYQDTLDLHKFKEEIKFDTLTIALDQESRRLNK